MAYGKMDSYAPQRKGRDCGPFFVEHTRRGPFFNSLREYAPFHSAWRPSGTALTLRVRPNTISGVLLVEGTAVSNCMIEELLFGDGADGIGAVGVGAFGSGTA